MSFARSSCVRAEKLGNLNYVKEFFNSGEEIVYSSRRVELDEYFPGPDRERVEFIKIDTDGSDYQVLTGARQLLESGAVLGLTIESQFQGPVHAEANVFGNIDRFLRARGFSLYDFEVHRYSRAELPQPFAMGIPAQTVRGQIQWGEALYFRGLADPDYEANWGVRTPWHKKLKLACLFELFGLSDCAAELLQANANEFASRMDLTKCFDLLTPPLCGRTFRYGDYIRQFETCVRAQRWTAFGRTLIPDPNAVELMKMAPAKFNTLPGCSAAAGEQLRRFGRFLGRPEPLSLEELKAAEVALAQISNADDAVGYIASSPGTFPPGLMPLLIERLAVARSEGKTDLSEFLELVYGCLAYPAGVRGQKG